MLMCGMPASRSAWNIIDDVFRRVLAAVRWSVFARIVCGLTLTRETERRFIVSIFAGVMLSDGPPPP